MTQWAEDLHRRVAGAIKRYRGDMSAQQLADRTAELGYPLSRAQIANYESGRKKNLDIAELLVIAAALNTSPVALLYPGPYGNKVEVLPGIEASEFHAAQWVSALRWVNIPEGGSGNRRVEAWRESIRDLGIYRRLDELEYARAAALNRSVDEDANDLMRRSALEAIAMYDREIRDLRQELGTTTYRGGADLFEYVDGRLQRLDDDDPRRQRLGDE